MLLHIPTILSRTQATSMQERLAAANWTDGRETVGPQRRRLNITYSYRKHHHYAKNSGTRS